jgi:hypothetical protein
VIKFRQPIHSGQKGRDVKAVKDGMLRMTITDKAHMNKNNRAGPAFVENIRKVQVQHKLKVDGVYGPKTHEVIAPHFTAFDRWRYRTARIRRIKSVTSPFPGGWIPNRLDMGFDGTFSGHIVAPFDGVVTYVTGYNQSWRGGIIQIKADNKPADLPTDTLYFAEGCNPLVDSGTRVKVGEVIGKEYPSGWGDVYGTTSNGEGQIEWGVAEPGVRGTYVNTYAIGLGLGSARSREMVLAFAKWAESLGLKPPTSTNSAGNA